MTRDSLAETPVNKLTGMIWEAAIAVHSQLGPGLAEPAYTKAMAIELRIRGLSVVVEKRIAVNYRGESLGTWVQFDLLVEDLVVIEVKATESVKSSEVAQLKGYIRISGHPVGMLFNFGAVRLIDQFHRVAN